MTATSAPATDIRQEFVITRVFDAPREHVWKAWAEAERLGKWWGPKDSSVRVIKLDFRPGGIFHYAMQFQPGRDVFGRFVYCEIVAPQRLIFVISFSDANAGITRAPFFNGGWPLEVSNTLTLSEQGGKTTLVLRGAPINAMDEERNTFSGAFDSMRQGFTGTFDQLAAYLSKH